MKEVYNNADEFKLVREFNSLKDAIETVIAEKGKEVYFFDVDEETRVRVEYAEYYGSLKMLYVVDELEDDYNNWCKYNMDLWTLDKVLSDLSIRGYIK